MRDERTHMILVYLYPSSVFRFVVVVPGGGVGERCLFSTRKVLGRLHLRRGPGEQTHQERGGSELVGRYSDFFCNSSNGKMKE